MLIIQYFRPYECTDCGKAYKDSASFKRHRLVHSGERPHVCTVCTESFIDSKSLKRHREIAGHPAEPRIGGVGGLEEEEEEDDEELIEPGQEEQYVPLALHNHLAHHPHHPHHPHLHPHLQQQRHDLVYSIAHGVEREEEVGAAGNGIHARDEDDDDLASNEGDLEIAETSADSGINSSMENNHVNQLV